MKTDLSQDYHDYIIKDSRFIGAFEEMYQHIDDPWHNGAATATYYDLALLLAKKHVALDRGSALDLGCGKGAFTARLKQAFPDASVTGIDIAPTAIKKAREKYGQPGIEFKVFDIREYWKLADDIGKDFELVVISDLMWYVLPEFEAIVKHLGRIVRKGGWLLINQTFYPPDEQQYGRDVLSCVEDMLKLISYRLVEMLEINRFINHHVSVLFQM